jgi:hypothetical protein
MPETMSAERKKLMTAYGAELVLTEGAKGMQGSIDKAKELAEEIEGAFIPDQFSNPANAKAHREGTGVEIYKDLDGDQFGDEQKIINDLSLLIESARQTNNTTDRSKDYAKALDLVMELAVELPTYQRHDLFAYNSERIDVNTLNQDATWTSGVIAKIWELNYYQQ